MKTEATPFSMPRAALGSLLVALCTTAAAQGMPKQFDFEVTYTFAVASATPLALGEKSASVPMSFQMVATNDKRALFMNQMFGVCAGSSLTVGGAYELLLGCTYEDKDGDKLFETARSAAQGSGKIAFVGGTGKFAGVQCEGGYKSVAVSKDGSKGIGKKTGSCRVQ